MGNHIHLLIKEEKEELGIVMRRIGASYVYWYNLKYDRRGHLFQDRYKSEVVEDEKYLLTVLRYIHQNPIKAGLVDDIKEYKWSSYLEYIKENKIVDTDYILKILDNDRKKAKESFKEIHKESSKVNCLEIQERRRIKDKEAIEIIKNTCNITHCSDLQNAEKDIRNKYLNKLKEKGLSTRQIARLTGISRHIILKA